MAFGFELDGGFKHFHGRWISRGFGAPGLAVDGRNLGQGFDEAVGLLQQLCRLASRQARQGGGHEQQITFIERWHELATNAQHGPGGGCQQQHRDRNRGAGPAQHHVEYRAVGGNQHAVERVFLLARNLSANQIAHQHRNQRDRQARRRRHGVGFGKRQRREQPALLGFEREHRDEGQRDDQQTEKQRRADFGSRVADDPPARFALQGVSRVVVVPALQMLVRVFNHHDRGINHGANGNRNAAQRHDVGIDALVVHHDKGRQNAQRQRDDGHQGRAQVKQKDKAHHSHDDELFKQFEAQVADRLFDQHGSVVGGNDLYASRQTAL